MISNCSRTAVPRKAKLYTAIIYPEPKTRSAGYVWGNIDVNLNEDQYQSARNSGIPLAIHVPRKQPKQLLKVIVYDPGTGRVGSRQITAR